MYCPDTAEQKKLLIDIERIEGAIRSCDRELRELTFVRQEWERQLIESKRELLTLGGDANVLP